MAASGYLDLYMNQGETYCQSLTLTDVNGNAINLANYLIASQMKKSYVTANVDAIFTVSVANSMSGMITLNLPYTTTQNLKPLRYVYDVIIRNTTSNVASRILEGTVYVDAGVTPSP